MKIKSSRRNARLTLHRETLKALETLDPLKKAAGGVSLKCPLTATGLAKPQCDC